MPDTPVASVIIPAHNEQAVVHRCLKALLADAGDDEFEVIVVANGCTDETVKVAKSVSPTVVVLDLAVASKTAALNAGDALAKVFPRIYLDADIEMATREARALANALRIPSIATAAPHPRFEMEGASAPVRAFYRAWKRTEFMNSNVVGNGVFALSKVARERFTNFPSITGDDLYVMSLFKEEERAVTEGEFVLHTPRKLVNLLAVRTRVYYGNLELRQTHIAETNVIDNSARSAKTLLYHSKTLKEFRDVVVYLAINAVAKVRALARMTGNENRWDRDDSSR